MEESLLVGLTRREAFDVEVDLRLGEREVRVGRWVAGEGAEDLLRSRVEDGGCWSAREDWRWELETGGGR